MATEQKGVKFDDSSPVYYPTACCEVLHSSKAIYASVVLQLTFLVVVVFLYFLLEKHDYIEATWFFRPTVCILASISALCNIFALYGVITEKTVVIRYQIYILVGMIVLCDTVAFCIVLIMAIGKRTYITAQLPSILVSEKKFERTFGPFWIYLTAITFHIVAAGMMCIIGVSKRYVEYLGDKQEFEVSRWKSTSTLHSVSQSS